MYIFGTSESSYDLVCYTGTDDENLTEQTSESEADGTHHMRGGRKDCEGQSGVPVVTTGLNDDIMPTTQGPSAVTTGQLPAGRTRAGGRAVTQRGRRVQGSSASA